MPVRLLMGNEAIGLGALHAGVNFVSGYPGTPSTEVLETVAKNNDGSVHVEWSTNEKAALEAAAGASYAGARTMVTMKQVGLNVASDPLMTLAYLGIEGGMVIVVADDPGPISSQTEQDTRTFAAFAKVPVLDPSSPGEAYGMVQDAFELSEKYRTPVILRPTTRVCHVCGTVKTRGGVADCGADFKNPDLQDDDPSWTHHEPKGFVKDSSRWVVFPKTSFLNHEKVEARRPLLSDEFSSGYRPNRIEVGGRCKPTFPPAAPLHHEVGIATGGVSYHYVCEALELSGIELPVLKVATPYPFPEDLALTFLGQVDEVVAVEELDPVIERELTFICGKHHLGNRIHGKLDGTFGYAGEQSTEAITRLLEHIRDARPIETLSQPVGATTQNRPDVPLRPPVLCAGCPHRASFYAVKRAVGKRKAVFCGDIGCYTLGNAAPLDMVDTCLCMGGGITVAQGIETIEPETLCFGFVGDSTFFASGITGVINAVHNHHDVIICVVDNSTTAMTGHQTHPGVGRTMMDEPGAELDIARILGAIGVDMCRTVDPLDLRAAQEVVEEAIAVSGVRAIIFKSPCIAIAKPKHPPVSVNPDTCTRCRLCIREIGCPALISRDGEILVDATQCFGCTLCQQICPTGAIESGDSQEEGAR